MGTTKIVCGDFDFFGKVIMPHLAQQTAINNLDRKDAAIDQLYGLPIGVDELIPRNRAVLKNKAGEILQIFDL